MTTNANATARTPAVEAAIDGEVLTLVFAGDTGNPLVVSAGAMTDDIRQRAMMHGLKQKLVDAAAISRNPDTGRSATAGDKEAAVREVFERLMSGEWNKTREGGEGGEGGASSGLLVRALIRMGKTTDEAKVFVAGLTKEQQAALRTSAKIAPVIDTIRAESAKADRIDADALLAGLGL